MLFHTAAFIIFFLTYFALHALLPMGWRVLLIVVGSTVFYSWWNPWYGWLPYALLFVAWVGARWIDCADDDAVRGNRLAITALFLFAPLFFFKYVDFLAGTVADVAGREAKKIVGLALPLGISFITFTLFAYVADVRLRRFKAESGLGGLAAYALFFPHLIAGPILRPRDFIPQLAFRRQIDWNRARLGAAIIVLGLMKKLGVADPLSKYVDVVYAGSPNLHAIDYLVAIYGFSVQIYCDFSGYSDMAIGLAMIIGIRLPSNFRRPYASSSIDEFWHRWHITLSKWLRDYLYIPLGGSRVGQTRQVVNVLITMILGGLWHGANWTFAIWGLVHGAGIAISQRVRADFFPRWLAIVVTFHFVTAAWILFRAPDLETAWRVASGPFVAPSAFDMSSYLRNAFAMILIAVFFLFSRLDTNGCVRWLIARAPKAAIWAVVSISVLWIFLEVPNGAKQFIYFEF